MRTAVIIFCGFLFSHASNAAVNINNQTQAITFLNAFKIDNPYDGGSPKHTEPFLKKSIQNAAVVLGSIEDGQEFNRVYDLFKTIVEYNFNIVYGDQCSRLHFFRYYYRETFALPMLAEDFNSPTPIEFALGLALQKEGANLFQKYKTLLDEFVSDQEAKYHTEEFGMKHGSYLSSSNRDAALAFYGLLSVTPLFPVGVGGLLYVGGKSCKDAILSHYYHSQLCDSAKEISPIIEQAMTTAQSEITRLGL